jgi:uncharacterized membrane protein YphA (DoxX/SURF4 family)
LTEINPLISKWINIIIRIILGGLFIYAAIPKILNPLEFALTVENYQIISPILSHYSALFLPWLELYCGILIIINQWTKYASLILAILLLIFIAALISVIIRGLEIDCGCFAVGGGQNAVSIKRVFEDFILLAMSIYLIFFDNIHLKIRKRNEDEND